MELAYLIRIMIMFYKIGMQLDMVYRMKFKYADLFEKVTAFSMLKNRNRSGRPKISRILDWHKANWNPKWSWARYTNDRRGFKEESTFFANRDAMSFTTRIPFFEEGRIEEQKPVEEIFLYWPFSNQHLDSPFIFFKPGYCIDKDL